MDQESTKQIIRDYMVDENHMQSSFEYYELSDIFLREDEKMALKD